LLHFFPPHSIQEKLGEEIKELELEKELTNHITKFLLEPGAGFAFMGR
jgi:predicted nuclease of restriction endonuclease-like (RecB) superfamily